MINVYHVTHNDADAIACDVIVKNFCYNNSSTYKYNYTTFTSPAKCDKIVEKLVDDIIEERIIFDDYRDDDIIIISDVSPSEEFSIDYATNNDVKVIMYDHHKTNIFQSYNKSNFEIYMNKTESESAALVMFNNMIERKCHCINFPLYGGRLYNFVKEVSNYDTWTWNPSENMGEDALQNISKYVNKNELSDEILEYLGTEHIRYYYGFNNYIPEKYWGVHETVKLQYKKYMEFVRYNIHVTASSDNIIGMLLSDNSNMNMSLVCHDLFKQYGNIFDVMVIMFPTSKSLSFRTAKDNIDVSKMAAVYGGGGHAKAAGCRLETEDFMSFMAEYYNADSLATLEYKSHNMLTPDFIKVYYGVIDDDDDEY